MPGLDPELVGHHFDVFPNSKPVKQPQRKYHPDLKEKANYTLTLCSMLLAVPNNAIINIVIVIEIENNLVNNQEPSIF